MESEKIIKLPKVELHCHLDGSLPMGIIRELFGMIAEILRNIWKNLTCLCPVCRQKQA